MRTNVIVLSDEEKGKTVGVLLHQPDSGRVLLKVRPTDQSLMQTFALWQTRPMIEQVRQDIRGKKITRRLRVIPTDQAYGKLLVDRFAKKPYGVRFSTEMEVDSLDRTLDELYASFVDVAQTQQPGKETSLGGWQNPFSVP